MLDRKRRITNRVRCLSVLFVPALFFLLSGCAYKELDPQRPQEYSDYWNNEQNRKASPVYPFTTNSREGQERERKGPYGP